MNVSITHITSSTPQYQQVWELREEVLRKPIGLSLRNEDLSADHSDVIFIAEAGDRVIGCLMLQQKGKDTLKFRQMAVAADWQGKGIGRKLMNAAEQYAATQNIKKIVLNARKVAMGFYKNLGYEVSGKEFTEVGIPHFLMEKNL